MKPHPIIRKTIKWGGVMVTVLLVVVWVWSGRQPIQRSAPYQILVTVVRGKIDILRFTPNWAWLARADRLTSDKGKSFELDWSFVQWHQGGATGRFLWALSIPIWSLTGLAFAITTLAWRLDTLARRRPRLNLCPKCHYDRTGLAIGAKCPECGQSTA